MLVCCFDRLLFCWRVASMFSSFGLFACVFEFVFCSFMRCCWLVVIVELL